MTETDRDAQALAEALERLGERGARRVDPVRWHLAVALARRAPAHAGAARRLIDARISAHVASLSAALGAASANPGATRTDTVRPSEDGARTSRQGPLGELLADATSRARPAQDIPARVTPAPPDTSRGRAARRTVPASLPAAPPEPPALHYFRRTWSRLKADERLAQSRDSLPTNAGPLNSHHLVHRALETLHALAPGYFEHFIGHVDDLLWIEAATGGAGPESTLPARTEGERRTRGR
jgi:hypothetical protein